MSTYLGAVAAITSVALILMVVPDVTGRFLFNHPITGSYEVASMLMVVIVWFSVALGEQHKEHLRVEVIDVWLSERARLVLDSLASTLGFFLFSAIMWVSFGDAIEATRILMVHPGVKVVPVYPFKWVLAVGVLFLALQFLRNIVRIVQQLLRRKV